MMRLPEAALSSIRVFGAWMLPSLPRGCAVIEDSPLRQLGLGIRLLTAQTTFVLFKS